MAMRTGMVIFCFMCRIAEGRFPAMLEADRAAGREKSFLPDCTERNRSIQMDTYLDMLQDSLRKKLKILDGIMEYQRQESEMLKGESMDMEAFDRNINDKVALAQSIDSLDDGFEHVYDRIRKEMIENKEKYAVQIKALQDMIREISEKNVLVQAEENRIRLEVDNYAKRESIALRQKRDNGKAARNYYNNMKKLNYVDSQFMDKKK